MVFEAGEESVESLVKLGCTVVVGEFGGEAAEKGELPWRQVVEAEVEGHDELSVARSRRQG